MKGGLEKDVDVDDLDGDKDAGAGKDADGSKADGSKKDDDQPSFLSRAKDAFSQGFSAAYHFAVRPSVLTAAATAAGILASGFATGGFSVLVTAGLGALFAGGLVETLKAVRDYVVSPRMAAAAKNLEKVQGENDEERQANRDTRDYFVNLGKDAHASFTPWAKSFATKAVLPFTEANKCFYQGYEDAAEEARAAGPKPGK